MSVTPCTSGGHRSFPAGTAVALLPRWFCLSSAPGAKKFVADSGHRDNQLRVSWIRFQFLAQAGHVHIHGAGQRICFVSPDHPEEFDSRNGDARPLYEVAQKLELAGRKINRLVVPGNFRSPNIDTDRPKLKNTLAGTNGNTPEQSFDASDEFRRLERLGDIVIGPQFEADDLVGGLVPRT